MKDYQQVKVTRNRNHLGRFRAGVKQSDIPKQCYLCENNVHEKCNVPDECGCECAEFIEGITLSEKC